MTWTFSKVVVCVSGSSTVIETETERTRHPLFLYFSSNLFQIKCFVVTTHLIVVWLVGWFEAVNSSYKDFLQCQWRELVEKFWRQTWSKSVTVELCNILLDLFVSEKMLGVRTDQDKTGQ